MRQNKYTFRSQNTEINTLDSKASVWSNRSKEGETISSLRSRDNQAFLHSRRQNQLNSLFKIRKTRLTSITKANRAIHEKINSQKTHYPLAKPKHKQISQQRRIQKSTRILGSIENFVPLPIPKVEEANFQLSMSGLKLKNEKISILQKLLQRPKLGKPKKLQNIFTLYD